MQHVAVRPQLDLQLVAVEAAAVAERGLVGLEQFTQAFEFGAQHIQGGLPRPHVEGEQSVLFVKYGSVGGGRRVRQLGTSPAEQRSDVDDALERPALDAVTFAFVMPCGVHDLVDDRLHVTTVERRTATTPTLVRFARRMPDDLTYACFVTESAVNVDVLPSDWREQVLELARERDAVILAHNYQVPEIQDIAHHVGDSLGLSRVAAEVEASTIVFCGVHFMAESAKILAYDKTVLIPDAAAGCSLVETINGEQLRAWKAEHPGAVVVSYVNTTAEVKAETDICCTSSNAVEVVESIPRDQEVLFLPDQFLGAHVQRLTGRDNMHIWMGECHVHAGINGADLRAQVEAEPEAELFVHPECGCATSALYLVSSGVVPAERAKVLSTGGMVDAARATTAAKVLVATETGMIHQLEKVNSTTEFVPVNRAAVCKYMKMITPAKLLRSLREGTDEVFVDRDIADRARLSVERMIAIGTPSATAE